MKPGLFGQSGDVSSFIDSFMPAYGKAREGVRVEKERKRSQQKLSEIFGGTLPEIFKGMENVPLDQAIGLAGLTGAMYGGRYKEEMAGQGEAKIAEQERHAPVLEEVAKGGLKLQQEKEVTETAEKTRVANQKRLDGLIDEKENLMDVARDPNTSFKDRDIANARIDQIIQELGMPKRIKGAISRLTDPLMRKIFGGAEQPGNVQSAPAAAPAPAQAAPVKAPAPAPAAAPTVNSVSEVKTAPDGTRYRVVNGQVEIVQ